jgi:hypothetical protein
MASTSKITTCGTIPAHFIARCSAHAIFMLAWCPLADMQPTSKIATCAIAGAGAPLRTAGVSPALLFTLHFHACVVSASGHAAYFENSTRLATNRHHRGSGKALKPRLPHYGSMKAFRPAARSNIFMLAWCPLADMQPTSKIAYYPLVSASLCGSKAL